jgi:hypothetical protein
MAGPFAYISLMNYMERIVKTLESEELQPVIGDGDPYAISWQNKHGDKCRIFSTDIAVKEEKLAWFESDSWSYHSLRIMEKGELFNWTPKTYNPVFGCFCLLLEWYQEHLIFIYQEKHDIYICSIYNGQVNHFNFNGEEIARKGNLISFDTYNNSPKDQVRILQIPELILLEPISKTAAAQMGLLPEGLNRPGEFLKDQA